MAKQPYQLRLEPELLETIRELAKKEKRSVNNMIEVLLSYGLEYVNIREENKLSPSLQAVEDRV